MVATMYKQMVVRQIGALSHSLSGIFEKAGEWMWFAFCLCLFIVLGPFSAPVVLIALCKLGMESKDQPEPELESSC